MTALQLLGYSNVRSLAGGFNAWNAAGMPVTAGKPADPVAGTAAAVDALRLRDLDAFVSSLPENFDGVVNTDVLAALGSATPPTLIDLRTAEEIKSGGYIAGSVAIPINELLNDVSRLPADKAASIVTICGIGHRGAIAMMALRMLGYTNANSMFKGMAGWKEAKLPIAE